MAKPAELEKLTGIASRFGAFVAERHPFALADALDALEAAASGCEPGDEAALRPAFHRELTRRVHLCALPHGVKDTAAPTSPGMGPRPASAPFTVGVRGLRRRAGPGTSRPAH